MSRRLAIALLLAVLPAVAPAAEPSPNALPLPDANELIRRFVERAGKEATNLATASYVYLRTNITEEFNRRGRLDEREELVLRIQVDGDAQEVKLLQVDGRTPTDKERDRHLKRFEKRREGSTRRERPDRSKQLDAYLNMDVLGRYVFVVESRELVSGLPCYKVSFKSDGREGKSDKLFERVLDRLTGYFWIDAEDYQLAKADIWLNESVSLWGGVLGGLDLLTLQINRIRDAAGVWRDRAVEAHFVGRAVTRHIDVRTRDLISPAQPVEGPPIVAAD